MDMYIALSAPVSLPHVEALVVGFVNHDTPRGGVSLPVTVAGCGVCGGSVPAGPIGGASRVDGDSRYGYEAVHAGCNW